MRGYAEELDVTTDEGEMPTFFVWRGRRYRVVQVVETWREHLPWWRLAVASAESSGAGEIGQSGHEEQRALRYETEQRVWRVEAAAGRLAPTGVFELAHRDGGWRLRRLVD